MSTSPWRLYRPEWVVVHMITMSTTDPVNIVQAANDWIDKHLKGRVRDNETRLDVGTDGTLLFWCRILVFKNNLKGEFKYSVNAENFATTQGYDEYTIVERNSAEDQTIRNYGVVML